jgi:hypothetical protein
MSEVVLQVRPASGGWWVDCNLPLEPTYYRSGARAEETARSLALRLCNLGRDVRVIVNDRGQQTVATQIYFAP